MELFFVQEIKKQVWIFKILFYFRILIFFLLGEIVALKRLKMEKEKEGFPITSLREICCILKSQHDNVCTVRVSSMLKDSES